MGKYTRKRGSRPYLTNYTTLNLQDAINCVRNGNSIGKAAVTYGVPKSTLYRKLNGKQMKQTGGQLSLSVECEEALLNIINQLTDWKVPLDGYDVRFLVKNYLDKRCVVHKRFTDNLPGNDWLRRFLSRHKLVVRLSDNVTPAKFEIGEASINDFFDHLNETLNGVPPQNIFNFDETNLTDDPSRKKCVVRRGLRRVEKKMAHSKQAFSIMFCGNATGNYIAPMVVYKVLSENIYSSWKEGGPPDTVYASTKSGWFDTSTFETWFFQIFLPHVIKLQGPKALIGDNLGCHFSVEVIKSCQQHDIRFVTLIPNTTHILQPLDVAVFRPAKIIWRKSLQLFRNQCRNASTIPKQQFPTLLYSLFQKLESKNLISGFEATGICPLNRQKVLIKLPGHGPINTDPGGSETLPVLNESCLEILRKHCQPSNSKRKPRGRKVNVVPGKAIVMENEDKVTWICHGYGCNKKWRNDDNRWIVCDICDLAFHLQCSGIVYEKKDYNDYDISGKFFSCDSCS